MQASRGNTGTSELGNNSPIRELLDTNGYINTDGRVSTLESLSHKLAIKLCQQNKEIY